MTARNFIATFHGEHFYFFIFYLWISSFLFTSVLNFLPHNLAPQIIPLMFQMRLRECLIIRSFKFKYISREGILSLWDSQRKSREEQPTFLDEAASLHFLLALNPFPGYMAERGFAQPASLLSSFFRKVARYCDPQFTENLVTALIPAPNKLCMCVCKKHRSHIFSFQTLGINENGYPDIVSQLNCLPLFIFRSVSRFKQILIKPQPSRCFILD